MGRFKSVAIEGLLITDFEKLFNDSLKEAIKSSELSDEDILKKLAPKWEKMVANYEDGIATIYLDHHKLNLNDFLTAHCNNQNKIAITHKNSFVPFILYINGCFLIFKKVTDNLRRKRIDSTLKTTFSLYGLILRRADELLSLLLNGYIDGAMIIWRSLYENAIVLLVLALENDKELADKYYQHSLRNSKKKVRSYTDNHRELKFPPLPQSTEKNLKIKLEKAETNFGKDFLESDYGWADSLFPGKQKANFRLLEEKVDLRRFRPYYLLCCEHIHPSFNGLGNYMEGSRIILPRLVQQDIEFSKFIDPMQFTLSILHEINDFILYEFSTESEYNVNLLLMRKIYEMQQASFEMNKVDRKRKKK